MNKIQVEQFNKKLKELGEFTKGKQKYSESEIIDWIAECTRVFYEIGVDAVIVRHFLEYFSFGIAETEDEDNYSVMTKPEFYKVKTIGPFHEKSDRVHTYSSRRSATGHYLLVGSFYYAKIAFSSAQNILKGGVEEKRIVPMWLIEELSSLAELDHISASLELIEIKYEESDTIGLIGAVNTLLQSVLDLDTDLTKKNKLGGKLRLLIDNEDIRGKFGVSKDLVDGLNCARLIRNEKVVHKDVPLKYDIPFIVAVSFAYLVLFFVECSILNGKIINYDKK